MSDEYIYIKEQVDFYRMQLVSSETYHATTFYPGVIFVLYILVRKEHEIRNSWRARQLSMTWLYCYRVAVKWIVKEP